MTPEEWAFKIAAIHPPVEGTWKAEFCREWMEGIAHFVGAACVEAVQAEREACADIAESFRIGGDRPLRDQTMHYLEIAQAIRARTAQDEGK